MPTDERAERFSRIVADHGDVVFRYIRRRHLSADGTDAEDILADVMAVAWRRLDDIPVGAETPWLIAVARNRLSNARRRGSRRTRIDQTIRVRGWSSSAEDESVAGISMRAALAKLTDKEREALTLTAWEGLTPAELAIALGISANAAAIRLSKAKARLLAMLGERPSESSNPVATGPKW